MSAPLPLLGMLSAGAFAGQMVLTRRVASGRMPAETARRVRRWSLVGVAAALLVGAGWSLSRAWPVPVTVAMTFAAPPAPPAQPMSPRVRSTTLLVQRGWL